MTELNSINTIDLLAIPQLCKKNYFIPDYQRGYRWNEVQIHQLLEDLHNFFYDSKSHGDFYCLQPIVVKEMTPEDVEKFKLKSSDDDNRWYEVIDGQQRLTTIRIILAIENLLDEDKNDYFHIYYQTRPELGKLFGLLEDKKHKDENGRIIHSIELPNSDKIDIDSWHIRTNAQRIIDWFQTGETGRPTISKFKGTFYENFTNLKESGKSVQVIWYELRDGSNPYDMFKRLNDKSVSLNNAELIRGLFLSDSASYPCDQNLLRQFNEDARDVVANREQARKQAHIIEQWDIIESQLRDEKFWAFVKQDTDFSDYSCRIEYIFDLISGKKSIHKDRLFTYLEFERMAKDNDESDLWDLWRKVETYFSLLSAWYKDSYYYHKIGYLVTELGAPILIELLNESSKISKSRFRDLIETKINESIHDRKKPGRRILDYTYKEDYNFLKRVLLLYNIESVYQQGLDFFPFDRYKGCTANSGWTLEHIHAQNSELIDQSHKDKWGEWFEENLKSLKMVRERLSQDDDLVKVIDNVSKEYDSFKNNKGAYAFKNFTLVFDMVLRYFNNLCEAEGVPTVIHGISNMALLSGKTNTSIGNSVFEVKRQMILEKDAEGEYIPLCTKKVFLKYYNKDNEAFAVQQSFYWSDQDRKNYLEDIKKVMAQYIDAEESKVNEADINKELEK